MARMRQTLHGGFCKISLEFFQGMAMKNVLYAGAVLTAFIAGPALAADLRTRAPIHKGPPPVVWSWTGCYIGGNAGGDWAKSTWSYRNINPYDLPGAAGPILATENSFSMSSWTAGVQAGCNYEFVNRVVIGVEGSWSGTNLNQLNANACANLCRLSADGGDGHQLLLHGCGSAWLRLQSGLARLLKGRLRVRPYSDCRCDQPALLLV